jgi:hypothetical protein
MQCYEYKVLVQFESGLETKLNSLGKEGWELIHAESQNSYVRMIFKRPLVEPSWTSRRSAYDILREKI